MESWACRPVGLERAPGGEKEDLPLPMGGASEVSMLRGQTGRSLEWSIAKKRSVSTLMVDGRKGREDRRLPGGTGKFTDVGRSKRSASNNKALLGSSRKGGFVAKGRTLRGGELVKVTAQSRRKPQARE